MTFKVYTPCTWYMCRMLEMTLHCHRNGRTTSVILMHVYQGRIDDTVDDHDIATSYTRAIIIHSRRQTSPCIKAVRTEAKNKCLVGGGFFKNRGLVSRKEQERTWLLLYIEIITKQGQKRYIKKGQLQFAKTRRETFLFLPASMHAQQCFGALKTWQRQRRRRVRPCRCCSCSLRR
jgi:hypothetical protein